MRLKDGKNYQAADDGNISRVAIEFNVEYGHIVRILRASGQLQDRDPRYSIPIDGYYFPIAETPDAILGQIRHYHRRLIEVHPEIYAKPEVRSKVALQRKIMPLFSASGSHGGVEAATLAISLEDLAMESNKNPGGRSLSRRLARFAAGSTDRYVLTQRTEGYMDLISAVSSERRIPAGEVARSLFRLGRLDRTDPRLHSDPTTYKTYSQLNGPEFMQMAKRLLRPSMQALSRVDESAYSPKAIKSAAKPFKALSVPDPTAEPNGRHRDLMDTIASVFERTAMNMHRANTRIAGVDLAQLIAASQVASQRAINYDAQARAIQNTAGKSTRQTRTDDGKVLQ